MRMSHITAAVEIAFMLVSVPIRCLQMVQRREKLGLPVETRQTLFVFREFYRHVSVELRARAR